MAKHRSRADRVDDSLSKLEDLEYHAITGRIGGWAKMRKNTLGPALSIGGIRGGFEVLKRTSKTEHRRLVRAVVLAIVGCGKRRVTDAPGHIRTWKNRTETALKSKLDELNESIFRQARGGATLHTKAADGHFYKLHRQLMGHSCGPACVKTVAALLGISVSERYARVLAEADEGHQTTLGQGGVVESDGTHDWESGGTWSVPAALRGLKIKCRLFNPATNVEKLLRATSPQKPAVAVVKWVGGGLHYVVAVGTYPFGSKTVIILDPWYGAKTADFTNLQPYCPEPGTGATFDSWVCTVTGRGRGVI